MRGTPRNPVAPTASPPTITSDAARRAGTRRSDHAAAANSVQHSAYQAIRPAGSASCPARVIAAAEAATRAASRAMVSLTRPDWQRARRGHPPPGRTSGFRKVPSPPD
ncbi:hypothetical protein FAF44_43975 [Nonomuraea sp. MG754425]|uniref:hypothetical protein n=1 Tax=Nonomuraea sp. MG754425 TaxID=2570319 RepID=UPI001F46471B|nr:hypothetical protein [Nonomuraea sp. MG754425]MCF6475280.1 hypothetical protein [Nonomuraea sp. MG754425]